MTTSRNREQDEEFFQIILLICIRVVPSIISLSAAAHMPSAGEKSSCEKWSKAKCSNNLAQENFHYFLVSDQRMHFSCSDKFSPQRSLSLDIAVNLNTKNPSGTDNFDCLHSFVVVVLCGLSTIVIRRVVLPEEEFCAPISNSHASRSSRAQSLFFRTQFSSSSKKIAREREKSKMRKKGKLD